MDVKDINEVNGRINHKVLGFGQTGLLTLFNNNTYVASYLNILLFFLFCFAKCNIYDKFGSSGFVMV